MKRAYTIILIFVLVIPDAAISQKVAKLYTNNLPKNGICAHRGAMETHPENTLVAFQEAIRLGAAMIEFDVRLTKDSVLVIMHDSSVNRTTDGKGLVSELTLAQLKMLDAGSWKSQQFKDERIPTLKETLSMMPANIWLNVHLKGPELLAKMTAQEIIDQNRIHQVVIACDYKAVKGVRKVSSDILLCNMQRLENRTEYINQTISRGYDFIQLKSNRDNKELEQDILMLKQHNVFINYYHAESESAVLNLSKLGVDFILSNHLQKAVKALNKQPN